MVEDFVWRLTGKQTMYQMIEFADEMCEARRRRRCDPLRIQEDVSGPPACAHPRIAWRSCAAARSRRKSTWCRARARWSKALQQRGLRLYLASGTDQPYMRDEAAPAGCRAVLRRPRLRRAGRLQEFLEEDSDRASDRRVRVRKAPEFLGFGDGYVEIENIKEVGGVAVGVATAEPECRVVDDWKRQRLAGVGADFIVPNYLCHATTNYFSRSISQWPVNIQLFDRSRLRIQPLAERATIWRSRTGWRWTKSPRRSIIRTCPK